MGGAYKGRAACRYTFRLGGLFEALDVASIACVMVTVQWIGGTCGLKIP
jgi:hypothetical protein